MCKYRKQEHIENYLRATYRGNSLSKDVFIEHNSISDFAYDNIDTKVNFMGEEAAFPLVVDAITGGIDFAENINKNLTQLAKDFNIPMTVGSQTITLEDDNTIGSFAVVREIIGPQGLISANTSDLLGLEETKRATNIIQADALQIHLNPGQELIMGGGDRDFKSIRKNIKEIIQGLDIPAIIKEVGFGMNSRVTQDLHDLGVRTIDLAGFGDTNFFEVENLRYPEENLSGLFSRGGPTALCLFRARDMKKDDLTLMGPEGIWGVGDCLRAMVMGVDIRAMSGKLLNYLIRGGYSCAYEFSDQLIHKMKILMVLTSCRQARNIHELSYRIEGDLKDLYEGRQ